MFKNFHCVVRVKILNISAIISYLLLGRRMARGSLRQ